MFPSDGISEKKQIEHKKNERKEKSRPSGHDLGLKVGMGLTEYPDCAGNLHSCR
ncbi:hypothetical protein PEC301877_01020 [Pectobacterium carotovorum subsp. carotovorum]|nr:hypothetical protein PEC301877_01020 [Pectobacterium carotovorum subsp. carotovorum]